MQYPQQERPIYVLPQNKKRIIIPRIVILVLLGTIFYLGILLNISLLDLSGSQETIVKTVSLGILILIVIFGIFLALRRAKQVYKFYRNGIKINKNEIIYSEITNTTPKQSFVDKMFKTQTIALTKKFQLKNFPEQMQLQGYIEQLIEYTKSHNTQI